MSSKKGFESYFTLHEKLGEGAHSVVYMCEENISNKKYAVKITKKRDEELIANIRESYEILKVLNYETILKANRFFSNPKKLTCHMVCELIEYPTL